MTPREILLAMLEWIKSEQHRATLPGQDPFDFTSLTHCAIKAGAGDKLEEVRRLLHQTAKVEGGETDAMRPHRAIFLINRTLATLA